MKPNFFKILSQISFQDNIVLAGPKHEQTLNTLRSIFIIDFHELNFNFDNYNQE